MRAKTCESGGREDAVCCRMSILSVMTFPVKRRGWRHERCPRHLFSVFFQRVKDKLNSRRLEVVCVGYDLFTSRVDTLAGYDWLMVVFDEVHMLKNPKSKRYVRTVQVHIGR